MVLYYWEKKDSPHLSVQRNFTKRRMTITAVIMGGGGKDKPKKGDKSERG